jgi:hypothetical protein
MPAVAEEKETAKINRPELAELLGVQPPTLSRAAQEKYFCRGYRVWEWAVWHPRGNQVRHYEVPKEILRDLVPPSEHIKYGL